MDAPDGTLRIIKSNKNTQYVKCIENCDGDGYKLSYIRKNDENEAHRLAQKSYDQRVKKLVDRRIKQLEKISLEYDDNEIEDIYNKLHPVRQNLITPVEKTWEQKLTEWKNTPYIGKEFKPGTPEIYTKKGERVRSKSEKIIADIFTDMGIDYKYECPLVLKGIGTVYPDFTILRKRDGREIYWEHDGRMDDTAYAEKAIRKINSYITNGIFPGKTLIISYESTGVVINDRIIKQMIKTYLA